MLHRTLPCLATAQTVNTPTSHGPAPSATVTYTVSSDESENIFCDRAANVMTWVFIPRNGKWGEETPLGYTPVISLERKIEGCTTALVVRRCYMATQKRDNKIEKNRTAPVPRVR